MRRIALFLLMMPLGVAWAGDPPTPPAPDDAGTLPARMCVQQTGTRIRPRPASTTAATAPARTPMPRCSVGRSYSREDLDRAGGAASLADALRRLDPSIH